VTVRRSPALGLLVVAKAPEAGRVKTRLCPPLTPSQAADLAAAALLDTLTAVTAVPGGRVVVALTGDLSRAARAAALHRALRGIPTPAQRGPDLGHRITAAHRDAAALLPGRPVLQLGMDTPQVEPDLLADAVAPLRGDAADAVLGPATDGGWWALGLRDPRAAAVIADVPTSRDDTGDRTLRALRAAGLRVALLPELTDVDTVADATAVARTAPGTRFAAALAALAPPRAGAA
jgi:rSAM/selenodomain-associated transferase 1